MQIMQVVANFVPLYSRQQFLPVDWPVLRRGKLETGRVRMYRIPATEMQGKKELQPEAAKRLGPSLYQRLISAGVIEHQQIDIDQAKVFLSSSRRELDARFYRRSDGFSLFEALRFIVGRTVGDNEPIFAVSGCFPSKETILGEEPENFSAAQKVAATLTALRDGRVSDFNRLRAQILTGTQPFPLPPLDLSGLYFNRDIPGANLSSCNLIGATFADINLHGVNLKAVNLTRANLSQLKLEKCEDLNLNGVTFGASQAEAPRFPAWFSDYWEISSEEVIFEPEPKTGRLGTFN